MAQVTNEVLMIRPKAFRFNSQTAVNNTYQKDLNEDLDQVQTKALNEFNGMVDALEKRGVRVNVLEDTKNPPSPDSIFPNNWFSTNDDSVVIYPMFAENRRVEVDKFLGDLRKLLPKFDLVDLRGKFEKILEGTGAMVLDRENKIAYASLSARADEELLDEFCKRFSYEKFAFKSYQNGKEIYHTNVMMSIGSKLAFVARDLVEESMRERLVQKLAESHKVIILEPEEIKGFAGNLLELRGRDGNFLIMSKTAHDSLSKEKLKEIEKYIDIEVIDVSTIENNGGGSVRCMVAELFNN